MIYATIIQKILPEYFDIPVIKCNIFLAATEEVRDVWYDI